MLSYRNHSSYAQRAYACVFSVFLFPLISLSLSFFLSLYYVYICMCLFKINKGVAVSQGIDTEDTITLNVQWLNKDHWLNKSGSVGHSVHTSSWCAPKADVHSQQRFFYMGHKGEVTVDQVHTPQIPLLFSHRTLELLNIFYFDMCTHLHASILHNIFDTSSPFQYSAIEDIQWLKTVNRSSLATPSSSSTPPPMAASRVRTAMVI
jgi:hypothetical protein